MSNIHVTLSHFVGFSRAYRAARNRCSRVHAHGVTYADPALAQEWFDRERDLVQLRADGAFVPLPHVDATTVIVEHIDRLTGRTWPHAPTGSCRTWPHNCAFLSSSRLPCCCYFCTSGVFWGTHCLIFQMHQTYTGAFERSFVEGDVQSSITIDPHRSLTHDS